MVGCVIFAECTNSALYGYCIRISCRSGRWWRYTADPVADYRGQIIVIGERPAGLNNVLAVITPNGTEEALSKNPQKAFKEMYTVEE